MPKNPFDLPDDHILVQAVKFLGIGILAAVTHYGTYVGLVEAASVDPTLATLAGFVISTGISYVLNVRYTFQSDLNRVTLVRFWTVTILGGLINASVVEFGARLIDYRIVGVIAIGCGASFNFAGHKLWTFRGQEAASPPAGD